jgi:hypothetical protein
MSSSCAGWDEEGAEANCLGLGGSSREGTARTTSEVVGRCCCFGNGQRGSRAVKELVVVNQRPKDAVVGSAKELIVVGCVGRR